MRQVVCVFLFVAACAADDSSSPVNGRWDYTFTDTSPWSICGGTMDLIAKTNGEVDGTWSCATVSGGGSVVGAVSGDDVHLSFDFGGDAQGVVTAQLSPWTEGDFVSARLRGNATVNPGGGDAVVDSPFVAGRE